MVEPISIALISGAASIGLALGRLTKNTSLPEEEMEFVQDEVPNNMLQFYSIEDQVDSSVLVENAIRGNQVFINIKKMITATDKLYKFLHQLKQYSENYNLEMHQITQDLILLCRQGSPISVKRLKKMVETQKEIDSDIFASS